MHVLGNIEKHANLYFYHVQAKFIFITDQFLASSPIPESGGG